jgi:hypothetical protein
MKGSFHRSTTATPPLISAQLGQSALSPHLGFTTRHLSFRPCFQAFLLDYGPVTTVTVLYH